MLVLVADTGERARIESALAPLALKAWTPACDNAVLVITEDGEHLAEIRRAHPGALLLVLVNARADAPRVLDGGADGVLCNSGRPAELRARACALLRRAEGLVVRRDAVDLGELRIDDRSRRVSVAGADVTLTPTQYALLACLATDPGRVFTKAELRARCWAERAPELGGRSLETQIARLRRRLGVHAPLLVTVWSIGYRLLGPADSTG